MKNRLISLLRSTERYTKTDMVYLAKGSFWSYASFIVTNLFALALSIAFAHFLPKEVYGTYQFLLSIGSILSAFTLSGMNSAVTQAVARGYEGVMRESIPVQLRYNLISTAVAIGISTYYGAQGNIPLALGVLLMGALIPVFSSFNTYTAFISGKKDFEEGFRVGVILTVAYNASMLASLFFIQDPIILILVNFCVNTVVTGLLYVRTLRRYAPNAETDPTSVSYGKHLSLAGVIGIVAGQLDNILVYHFLGTVNLAIYAFASTVPERLSSVTKSITLIAFPKLSQRTDVEIRTTMLGKSLRLAALSSIVAIAYILLAPTIFGWIFPKYLDSVLYSEGYVVALIFMTLPSLPVTGLTAMQAKKEIYAYNIVSPIVSIGTMVVLTAMYGIWGLIIAKGVAGTLNYGVSLYLISRKGHMQASS